MKRTFSVALMLVAIYAGAAQGDSSAPFESIETSCSDAPAAAKIDLPSDLQKWAKLSCTKYGHVIRAAAGWVWHAPQSNQFVRLWAQPAERDFAEVGHSSYFTLVEFRKLSQHEAEEANQALSASLGAKPQAVSDAYLLTATDNGGRVQTIHFVRSEANVRIGNLWGWSCSVPCSAPTVFMAFRP
ncbi:MAG: hypothetical protein K0M66_11225 [Thiobacillus sp.]|nr:hypothetical protein [Thiobacillus sp.]